MSLIDRVKRDIATITTNLSEFGQSAVLTDPQSNSVQVKILHTIHYTGISPEGMTVNTLVSSGAVSMSEIENYVYRNENGSVSFKNHKLTIDSVTYVIREWYPDETAGLIVLILGLWQ